jgi:hypothetical protein
LTESSLWITPLLILPGVALLILSTSFRFNRLHDEIDHIVFEDHASTKMLLNELLIRGTLFRNALISLYVSVAFLAVAGLFGASLPFLGSAFSWIPASISGLAVAFLVYAALLLIKESRSSLGIIEAHIEDHQRRQLHSKSV